MRHHELFVVALAVAVTVALERPAHAEPCAGFTECCRDTCDYSCCFAASGFTDPSGCKSAGGSEYCAYGGCTTYCGTCDIACLNAKTDAGPGLPDAKFDAVGDLGDTAVTDSGATDGPPSPELPQLVVGEVCYVMVHGSLPLFDGPAPKMKPGLTYWGDGKIGDPTDLHADDRGQFLDTMLTGKMGPASGLWTPNGTPLGPDRRWAAVTYNATLPYYWAAVDVLQQLEAIETEKLPVSLSVLEQEDGSLRHAVGTNLCKKDDKLILVGHSMGGMVVSFLLQNMRPDDLNHEFLRTGGNSPNVPYYDDAKKVWVTSKKDEAARAWNRNKVGDGKKVLWGKSTGKVTVPGGLTDDRPGTEPRCFYPRDPFAPNDKKQVFPDPNGICRGDAGTQTVAQTLDKIAYVYGVQTPLRGTPGAHCSCQVDPGGDTPTFCQISRKISDCLSRGTGEPSTFACDQVKGLYDTFKHGDIGFGTCNPALESMQTEAPYLVENSSVSPPGRLMFMLAGTDPSLNGRTLLRAMDCVQPGAPRYCPLLTNPVLRKVLSWLYPGGAFPAPVDPPTYAPAMNDQAVSISSAMGCRFDLFSEEAILSVGDNTLLAGSDFRHAMCVGNEKIWPGWVRSDAVLAVDHTAGRIGTSPREAYAPSDSFWTHVTNVRWLKQKYQPGESLVFGVVGSKSSFGEACFLLRMGKDQSNPALCTDEDVGRTAFMGCGKRCILTSDGVAIKRQNPTFGRIIWIEENWRRGPG